MHENKNEQPEGPLEPGLYIVGTPIGNLQDITLRALDVLRRADRIMAEDTRHSRKLLSHFDIHKPLTSCHKFNEAARVDMFRRLICAEGQALAMVTDSGMPCISDPGARIVAVCREEEIPVTVIPGPSALTCAVALSGMVGKGFFFEGFLSNKGAARRNRLAKLSELDVPLVFFESPHRLLKMLADVEKVLGPRRTFVGRELTKLFEEALSGTPGEIAAAFDSRKVKGECVVVVDAG